MATSRSTSASRSTGSPARTTTGSMSSTWGPSRCKSARTGATRTVGGWPVRRRQSTRRRRPIVSSEGETRSNGSVSHAGIVLDLVRAGGTHRGRARPVRPRPRWAPRPGSAAGWRCAPASRRRAGARPPGRRRRALVRSRRAARAPRRGAWRGRRAEALGRSSASGVRSVWSSCARRHRERDRVPGVAPRLPAVIERSSRHHHSLTWAWSDPHHEESPDVHCPRHARRCGDAPGADQPRRCPGDPRPRRRRARRRSPRSRTVARPRLRRALGRGEPRGARRPREDLIAATREATQRWSDVDAALADGFSPNRGGIGPVHYRNVANRRDDGVLDPDHPEALVYLQRPNGDPILLGAVYVVTPLPGAPDPGRRPRGVARARRTRLSPPRSRPRVRRRAGRHAARLGLPRRARSVRRPDVRVHGHADGVALEALRARRVSRPL